jgi:hypothetical protein
MTITAGCSYYANLSGRVVDGPTGRPIKGGLVVAQWTKPRGMPGLQHHELHKITETETDHNGKFTISGTFGFLLDSPEMIIYKAGYTPWRNDMIFPGGTDRLTKDHEWKTDVTYKLDVFTGKYTASELYMFLGHGMLGWGGSDMPKFTDLMNKLPVY